MLVEYIQKGTLVLSLSCCMMHDKIQLITLRLGLKCY